MTRLSSVAVATKKIFCSAMKRMCYSESASNFRPIVMLSNANHVDTLSFGTEVQTTDTASRIAFIGSSIAVIARARFLADAGVAPIVVFDESRGPGCDQFGSYPPESLLPAAMRIMHYSGEKSLLPGHCGLLALATVRESARRADRFSKKKVCPLSALSAPRSVPRSAP